MFIINQDQIDKLDEAARYDFENRMVAFLQTEFPDAQKEPPEKLKKGVQQQIDKSFSYDLTTEQQVARYISTAWLMGPDFDTEFPKANHILTFTLLSPEEKSEAIVDWSQSIFLQLQHMS